MPRKTFRISRETGPFSSYRANALLLTRVLGDCASVLDVGCGGNSILRFLPGSCKLLVGIDSYRPDLDRARAAGTHDELILADARDLNRRFVAGQFDAAVALDVIEHLTRKDGIALLENLELIAGRRVVISTPTGFLPQSADERGDYQEHLSGWEPEELRKRGYRVTGLNGPKILRADHHRLRFRPAVFWAPVSRISQRLWCRKHPETAAALLAVKEIPA